jgi:Predicted nucleotide-binding protein containing TIR-like domain/haloacid dehalogenase-like hydrolase
MFREKNFTRKFAEDNFGRIQMRPGADRLLSETKHTFLVTSGPSYFIDFLAEKYRIPKDRVICSSYDFDKDGLINSCIKPVNSVLKAAFVEERAERFDVSIGVGDTEQDFAFLSHCNVRVMMSGKSINEAYFTVTDLNPILDYIQKFQTVRHDRRLEESLTRLHAESAYEKNVFIMTPFRNEARYRETVKCIRNALQKFELQGWVAADLDLHDQLWGNVETFLVGCRAGIAILTHDDVQGGNRTSPLTIFNPNVLLELGYLLSHRKPILILKDKTVPKLPTDLGGFIYADFDLENAAHSIFSAVDRWVTNRLLSRPRQRRQVQSA